MKKKKVKDDFYNYDYYEKMNEEISQETIKKRRIRAIKNNPKELGEVLDKLNLTDSEYINFSFKEIDSTGIVFVFCDLSGSDFSNCVLTNCDFTFANLQNCNFKDAVLTNCNFRHTNLKNTDFWRAKLMFCDFTGANISLLKKH